MTPTKSVRLLVSQLGGLSDVVQTLPVVCALKEHHSDVWVGSLVSSAWRSLVAEHGCVDEAIEIEPDWFRSLTTIRETRVRMRSLDIDVTIDCTGTRSSAFAMRMAGAERRIGYGGRQGYRTNRLLYNESVAPVFSHLTDRALELLTPLGIHAPRVQWNIPVSKSARVWAQRWKRMHVLPKLAMIHPGAAWRSKQWETDRYASTARYIHDRYGYRTVVNWRTYEERLLAEEIVQQSGSTAILSPDTDLNHLAALLEVADLFVGGDCGPLHVAVAVGTPVIGLYGASEPSASGPYGRIALQRAEQPGSRRYRARCGNEAMQAIGVEHVCQLIDEMEAVQGQASQVA